jgi:hypothetical protein
MKGAEGAGPRQLLAGPLAGVLSGAGYGLMARLVFGFPNTRADDTLGQFFGVMSLSFLVLVPIALGALSVAALPRPVRLAAWTWIVLPLGSCMALMVGLGVTLLEGAICIVMAMPVFAALALVGGVGTGLLLRRRERSLPPIAALALLPFLSSPVELRTPPIPMEREVLTERLVSAAPETVWREVIRVPEIAPGEIRGSFFTAIGIPQPRQALLDREGPGALRTASFREGITFHEPITLWEANRRLGFRIQVVPESIAPGVLDDHVRVGGEHFEVTWGEFRLEPAAGGRTRLVLLSRHRLTTRFNAYAGLWSDAVMGDLQARICDVIARRAERAGPAS